MIKKRKKGKRGGRPAGDSVIPVRRSFAERKIFGMGTVNQNRLVSLENWVGAGRA